MDAQVSNIRWSVSQRDNSMFMAESEPGDRFILIEAPSMSHAKLLLAIEYGGQIDRRGTSPEISQALMQIRPGERLSGEFSRLLEGAHVIADSAKDKR